MISILMNDFDGAKENMTWQMLTLTERMILNSVVLYADCAFKIARISPVCFITLYSKLYILTKLNANDVNITSIEGQNLDLSRDYTYGSSNSMNYSDTTQGRSELQNLLKVKGDLG